MIIMIPYLYKKKGNLYFEKVKMDLKKISKNLLKGIPPFIYGICNGYNNTM